MYKVSWRSDFDISIILPTRYKHTHRQTYSRTHRWTNMYILIQCCTVKHGYNNLWRWIYLFIAIVHYTHEGKEEEIRGTKESVHYQYEFVLTVFITQESFRGTEYASWRPSYKFTQLQSITVIIHVLVHVTMLM